MWYNEVLFNFKKNKVMEFSGKYIDLKTLTLSEGTPDPEDKWYISWYAHFKKGSQKLKKVCRTHYFQVGNTN